MKENEKPIESVRIEERISRALLRGMRDGEVVRVVCKDAMDMESQKNTSYAAQRIVGCKFRCKTDDLVLTVRREG